MLSELRGTALVTGGGRGIGANIARELARAGMEVAVTGRTAAEVQAVAEEIGGSALVGDVSRREDVARWCGDVGAVDLLVNNAGISGPSEALPGVDEWWHVFEVNVLGVYMCCRAWAPLMVERGGGRIVNVASGSAYLPPGQQPSSTAYPASKAAVHRFSEVLAADLAPKKVFVFSISPGLVRTAMTSAFGDDLPWTPPEAAPRLVHALAGGEFDALAGRYLHAEHDPPETLRARIDTILADDLNAVRLRR
ncbi:MAG: SDR family oxidoreductase [Actinobacteria bacterium]|nr:SDR family oxidoreductase [Actinomycetota bacterium]MBV8479832.1 SDR family oxidoreductase [Actinomycetota bacterium]